MDERTLRRYSDVYFLVGALFRVLREYIPFDIEVDRDWQGWNLGQGPLGRTLLVYIDRWSLSIHLVCGLREPGEPDVWSRRVELKSDQDLKEALEMAKEWLLG